MSEYITTDDARSALRCMDDYTRLPIPIDAHGPRGVLESFILQVEASEMRSRFIPIGGGYRHSLIDDHQEARSF